MVALAYLCHCCLTNDRTAFSHALPKFIIFLIGYNCVVFTSVLYALNENKTGGHRKQYKKFMYATFKSYQQKGNTNMCQI